VAESAAVEDFVQEDVAARFDDDGALRCRPFGPAIDDFPLARGLLSIQGVEESRSDGAPPTAPWTTLWSSCREACAVFLFSVRSFL
jgi:hypothetical protein